MASSQVVDVFNVVPQESALNPEQARSALLSQGVDPANLSDSRVFAIAKKKQDEIESGASKNSNGINGIHSDRNGARRERGPSTQEELEFKTIRRKPRDRDSIILDHKESEAVGRIMG